MKLSAVGLSRRLRRPLLVIVLGLVVLIGPTPINCVVSPKKSHRNVPTPTTLRPTQEEIIFDDKECRTPQGYPGECISIVKCPKLLEALQESTNVETERFLLRSRCGRRIGDVCCGFAARSPAITDSFNEPTGFSTMPSPINRQPPPTVSKQMQTYSSSSTTIPTPRLSSDKNKGDQANMLASVKCGIRQRRISDTRIVGGEPSRLGEWPWITALGYRKRRPTQPEPRFGCAGTLITEKHVLTAGHCVIKELPYLARIGDLNLMSHDDGASPVEIPVEQAVAHPQYDSSAFTNDIAIIKFTETVHFNKDIQPICLPMAPELRSNNHVRNVLTVAGWGATYYEGPVSPEMQHVLLPVLSNEACTDAYTGIVGPKIGPGNICAGYINKRHSICQGDSGGPLMHRTNGTFYVIGIVSYGVRCSEAGYPGVFTRVTNYLDWIEETVR